MYNCWLTAVSSSSEAAVALTGVAGGAGGLGTDTGDSEHSLVPFFSSFIWESNSICVKNNAIT